MNLVDRYIKMLEQERVVVQGQLTACQGQLAALVQARLEAQARRRRLPEGATTDAGTWHQYLRYGQWLSQEIQRSLEEEIEVQGRMDQIRDRLATVWQHEQLALRHVARMAARTSHQRRFRDRQLEGHILAGLSPPKEVTPDDGIGGQ